MAGVWTYVAGEVWSIGENLLVDIELFTELLSGVLERDEIRFLAKATMKHLRSLLLLDRRGNVRLEDLLEDDLHGEVLEVGNFVGVGLLEKCPGLEVVEVGDEVGGALVGVLAGDVAGDRAAFVEDKAIIILAKMTVRGTFEQKAQGNSRCRALGRTAAWRDTPRSSVPSWRDRWGGTRRAPSSRGGPVRHALKRSREEQRRGGGPLLLLRFYWQIKGERELC